MCFVTARFLLFLEKFSEHGGLRELCTIIANKEKPSFLLSTNINRLNQTVVFVAIQIFPGAFFPVLMKHRTIPALPFLSARSLGTSFSLCSLQSWRSSHSRGSLISVTTITSIPPGYPWGTRLAMAAGLTCAAKGRWLWIKRRLDVKELTPHIKGLFT